MTEEAKSRKVERARERQRLVNAARRVLESEDGRVLMEHLAATFRVNERVFTPVRSGADVYAWQLQQEQALVRVATESARRDLQEGQRVLKEKWGDQYDANIKLAIQAATVAGVDPRSVPGFADPQTVMAFVNLARRISDDQFVASGRSSALGKGGAAEAREIQTNPDHSLYKRYHGGDTDTVEYVRSLLRQG